MHYLPSALAFYIVSRKLLEPEEILCSACWEKSSATVKYLFYLDILTDIIKSATSCLKNFQPFCY